ncbi:hypothetical protein [Rhodococcus opacus]|jgi:hypothetical protein|uniref:hypothetical protein n=1 Tax=Rhodococcus opacus TaxID=37919 RepID=UPI001E45F497|nr:hypothetical protein [Rhodococcus opacus]
MPGMVIAPHAADMSNLLCWGDNDRDEFRARMLSVLDERCCGEDSPGSNFTHPARQEDA